MREPGYWRQTFHARSTVQKGTPATASCANCRRWGHQPNAVIWLVSPFCLMQALS